MNIFLLFGSFIVLMVAGFSFVCVIITSFSLRGVSWKGAILRISICLLPLALVLMAFSKVFGPVDYTSSKDLSVAYEKEFGAEPPPDVADIKFRVDGMGDSFAAWMSFHASSETIDALIKKFVPHERSKSEVIGDWPSAPNWWRPDAEGIEVYYEAEGWDKSFTHSFAYLGVNKAKTMVFFYHDAID